MGLSPELRAQFFSLLESRTYNAGTTVFRAGESIDGAFYVHRGRVALWLDPGPKARLLHTAESGEMVGLSSCVSGLPCEVEAKCLTPCELGFIRSAALSAYVRSHPQAWPYLAHQLATCLSNANCQVLSLKKR